MPLSWWSDRAHKLWLIKKYTSMIIQSDELLFLLDEISWNKKSPNYIKASLNRIRARVNRLRKVPLNFLEDYEVLKSQSISARKEAKKNNDYSWYSSTLSKVFDYTKRYAEFIDPNKDPYDILLDQYDQWLTKAQISQLFSSLSRDLQKILPEISSVFINVSQPHIKLSKREQKDFLENLCSIIWFDFKRGLLWDVNHPFECMVGIDDIRINTNLSDFFFSYSSTLHELGHWLYEQNINPDFYHVDILSVASKSVDEAQARWLENIIGKSKEFVEFAVTIMNKFTSNRVDHDEFYSYINKVWPSKKRIYADELTYNYHIILRFELETKLLSWELKFDDLPEAWNEKMNAYLGISVDNPSNGCLQDIHWAGGDIAYFPTYTIGNIIASQIWNEFNKENKNFSQDIVKWDFSRYFSWYKNNIRNFGATKKPNDLIKDITWKELSSKYFVEYLRNKFTK